jgi:hypothetical protein
MSVLRNVGESQSSQDLGRHTDDAQMVRLHREAVEADDVPQLQPPWPTQVITSLKLCDGHTGLIGTPRSTRPVQQTDAAALSRRVDAVGLDVPAPRHKYQYRYLQTQVNLSQSRVRDNYDVEMVHHDLQPLLAGGICQGDRHHVVRAPRRAGDPKVAHHPIKVVAAVGGQ